MATYVKTCYEVVNAPNHRVSKDPAKLRVLIADDAPTMLDAMSWTIERGGDVEVVATASNGIGAIRAAQQVAPDLAILDVNMPVMNGLEAALHIKRRIPETKVLMVSADEDPELGLAALACGADGFICKRDLSANYKDHLVRLFPRLAIAKTV